jgi:hypothetical protein
MALIGLLEEMISEYYHWVMCSVRVRVAHPGTHPVEAIFKCLRIQFWKPMPGASIGDSPDTESADCSCQRYMMDSTKKGMEYLNSVSVQFETPSIGLGIHILQTALKKRNVKPQKFCGSAVLFSFGSDNMESQRSSVLRDLFRCLSARRPKQWDNLGTDSKIGTKAYLILYLHLIDQHSRGSIFRRASESTKEAGVWVPDIVTSVVESAVEPIVKSNAESVVISICRSFIDGKFIEPGSRYH